MTTPNALTLYTINMSHYSEKIRWLLDYEGIPYVEKALTPAIHALPMLLKGGRGQTTVPLVQSGNVRVQNSPRIVDWLAREYGPLTSFPEASRDEIVAIQRRFDAIGKGVARYLYLPGFAHSALILDIWTQFSTPWENRVVRVTYPVIKAMFQLKLKINKKDVAIAQKRIDAEIKWLEGRIKQGRYLVGNNLTVADITAASLLAPLACPPEHPIYGTVEFREKMAGAAQIWANSPALQWVRDLYAEHRGQIWKVMPNAA
ncbi:MAG: glutathione S-transferase family protein [Alcanivoracaceae bacterium]|nr:glutathione S-transferase family protein [Alcanivoracaceae bacterium]